MSTLVEMKQIVDDRVDGTVLNRHPYLIPVITVLYVIFARYLGPKWMKNREPFKIDKVLIVYNLIQMMWCFKLLCEYAFFITKVDYTCRTNPDKALMLTAINGAYSYFLMKLVDLFDTVFFVMRKKFNQITHLHVYHHALMVLITYYFFYYSPSIFPAFLVLLNIFVHFFMYAYYLISAYWKSSTLWWKKHITQLQLLQFVLNIIVYTQLYFRKNCHMSYSLTAFMVIQNIYMVYLFGKFYYATYIKRKTS